MLPIIKYYVRRETIKFLLKKERNLRYRKKFHAKSDKTQKIFFCAPVSKFQKISTLHIWNKAKQIYPKKWKKLLRKDTLRVSEAVVRRCSIKKVSLKILPPVYLSIIEIDIRFLQQPVKICQNPDIRKYSPFFNILLWTSLVLCRSVNKNVLEWFLLITSKEYTLTRSKNFSRNHPILCFWLKRKGQKMSLG